MDTDLKGVVLGGRYRLLRQLGAGATALVYEAEDRQLQRPVAVKLLRVDQVDNPALQQAFQAEAQAAARLNHPGLANVYDTGQYEGRTYIVMERVAGTPLTALAHPTIDLALAIGAQLAAALAFVHQIGLVHCDVKPSNILVDAHSRARLIDFGGVARTDAPIANATAPIDAALTRQLPIVKATPGALPYLAPERLAGAAPSVAGDIYSLGAVLYQLLSGRPPYSGTSIDAVERAQQAGPPPQLRELNPLVPPTVATLVERAIEADPARRFASADELLGAIEQAQQQAQGQTAAVQSVPAPVIAAVSRPRTGPITLAHTMAVFESKPGTMVLMVGVLLLVLLAAGFLLTVHTNNGALQGAQAAEEATQTPLVSLVATLTPTSTNSLFSSAEPTATATTPATAAPSIAPDLRGNTIDQAQRIATQSGFTLVEADGIYSTNVAAGLIMSQQPDPGTQLTPSNTVAVVASRGPQPQPVAAPQPSAGGSDNGNNGNGDKGKGNDKGKDKGKK